MKTEGRASQWTRIGDSGGAATFSFCPVCGSTVFWEIPGFVAVAVGAFADPNFPPPVFAVYEDRQHEWTAAIGGLQIERWR